MTGADLYLAMQELEDVLVEKYAQVRHRRTVPLPKLIAACLAAVLLVCGGAVTVDAIAYSQAKDFFAENGLPTEGLSREEIKAVYRDITSESFTYEKTGEVITKSISEAIPGYEITVEMDDAEKLKMLWDSWRNGEFASYIIDREGRSYVAEAPPDIWYYDDKLDTYHDKTGYTKSGKELLFKYEKETLCWETAVPVSPRTVGPVGDCTVLLGKNIRVEASGEVNTELTHNRILFLDKDGQILWNNLIVESDWISLSGGAGQGYAGLDQGVGTWIFDNHDETFTILNYDVEPDSETRYVLAWRYDTAGQLLSHQKNAIEYKMPKVFQLGNRYILVFRIDEDQTKTVVMDADGNLLTGTEYQITDQYQTIQDIAEVGNYRYISAYTMYTDKEKDEQGKMNYALTQELQALWEQGNKIPEKELVERIRSHYTAVLLRCDIETGEIQTFYSVPGMIAEKLEVRVDGTLIWRLQSLAEAQQMEAPRKCGWIVEGTSVIYEYIFDAEGNLTGKETTGELASFRW